MSKVFVIPDVHLKPWMFDKAEELLSRSEYDKIVCMGDLVDDWDQEKNLGLYSETFDALEYAMEKIAPKQYERLMSQYNAEYEELEALVAELSPRAEECDPKADMASFITLAKKYTDFGELTPLMVSKFIDKIIVHESNGIRGLGRKQKIEIYFNFIGQFIPPIPEEEIREEAEKQAAIQADPRGCLCGYVHRASEG